ncbi:hypothetical protein [Methylobacterium oryzihabitans]|uniref:Uncharacterized protein n=1 Tax=Methylobacterium oryzihabitans TaxID=2499852 RepID=A0A437PD06_9HYPH|nr:hypothetical protein [Methylobacterium oryzihabitans]RVU20130.1 hypothetical protein EOE48_05830 [Methylobacterium oryzihabitans]
MLDAYTATEIVRARQIHAAEGPKDSLWNDAVRRRATQAEIAVLLSDEERHRYLEQARAEIRGLHAG